jgi:hypothetical protein
MTSQWYAVPGKFLCVQAIRCVCHADWLLMTLKKIAGTPAGPDCVIVGRLRCALVQRAARISIELVSISPERRH